jgi:uroporphyrinogen-III synthase
MSPAAGSLAGKRIVVTRRAEQAAPLAALIEERAGQVLLCPTIEVMLLNPDEAAPRAAPDLATQGYPWTVFTSVNGVEAFFALPGIDPGSALAETQVAAVGTATRRALEARGVHVVLVPERSTAAALAEALGAGSGEVLLPRAREVSPEMDVVLGANGWTPVPLVLYETRTARRHGPGSKEVRAGAFDAVTFTSGSTVRGFVDLFGERTEELGLTAGNTTSTSRRAVAVIGPVTAEACRARGLRVDAVAEDASPEGMVRALEAVLGAVAP